MDLLHVFILLFSITRAATSSKVILHVDYLQDPPVRRYCIEVQCPRGTQPKLCEVEYDNAVCENCPANTYQDSVISSHEIIRARRCKKHNNCSEGWFYFYSQHSLTFLCFCPAWHYIA